MIGFETLTKNDFLKKKIKTVLKPYNDLKWILHYKSALKNDFLQASLFSHLKYRGRNSEKIGFFKKKLLKWNGKTSTLNM